MFKRSGYLVSILSVVLLAITSWKGAKDDPLLLAVLVLGVLTSIGGMVLRWISFERDEKANPQSAPDRASPARPAASERFPARRERGEAERPA